MSSKALMSCLMLLTLWSCQSREDRVKSALRENLIQYIQHQHLVTNGSVKIHECTILDVDTLSEMQFDSTILLQIRKQRAFYDSMADDRLKTGNLYNHLAYSYQKSRDTAAFNLAILNATESHYMAGNFIDSSMAFQKADELMKDALKNASDTAIYYRAKTFLRATYFNNRDSTKVHNTFFYHFNSQKTFIDLNGEVERRVRYEIE